jgi:hypothetical protein
MIRETIITTQSPGGEEHIAPMGLHLVGTEFLLMPFQPSRTLDNILRSGSAVANYCDDVRVFAGCLTGRRDWPTLPAERIHGCRLRDTLAHTELELIRVEPDSVRPRLYLRAVHEACHIPFRGFNRAQFAVLEAAILVSRLELLPWSKIDNELQYLQIGLDKTAGPCEREAWGWLMEAIAAHRSGKATDRRDG